MFAHIHICIHTHIHSYSILLCVSRSACSCQLNIRPGICKQTPTKTKRCHWLLLTHTHIRTYIHMQLNKLRFDVWCKQAFNIIKTFVRITLGIWNFISLNDKIYFYLTLWNVTHYTKAQRANEPRGVNSNSDYWRFVGVFVLFILILFSFASEHAIICRYFTKKIL